MFATECKIWPKGHLNNKRREKRDWCGPKRGRHTPEKKITEGWRGTKLNARDLPN